MFNLILRRSLLFLCLLAFALGGCATHRDTTNPKPFNFSDDTFAYANLLVWDYYFDDAGKWSFQAHKPKPDYTHHCFVVVRAAKQFFEHARFNPELPKTNDTTYSNLIDKVIGTFPSTHVPESERIVIPGYANLKQFSLGHEAQLKAQCGGAWQSYFQHGHWRIISPFSRNEQEEMAQLFLDDLAANHPPVVHLVRFPKLSINHAILVLGATETPYEIRFDAYDPNKPDAPKVLRFDRVKREFYFDANDYFYGGMVNVYEVYRDWRY